MPIVGPWERAGPGPLRDVPIDSARPRAPMEESRRKDTRRPLPGSSALYCAPCASPISLPSWAGTTPLHPRGAFNLLGLAALRNSQPFAPLPFSLFPPPPADAPRSLPLALPERRRGPEAVAGARKEGLAERRGQGRVFPGPAPGCARRWRRRPSLALRDRYRLGAML